MQRVLCPPLLTQRLLYIVFHALFFLPLLLTPAVSLQERSLRLLAVAFELVFVVKDMLANTS